MTTQPPAALVDYLVEQTCLIQQIPAPTFHEERRAAYLLNEFIRLGLKECQIDATGNVLARWPGHKGLPVIISAHLDTVHPLATPLTMQRDAVRLIGPGVGDNSLGLATLLALGRLFSESGAAYQGDIWLIGDVCEEGQGNLIGMKAIVERFARDVSAYLVLEGMGLGQICHRGLGVARFRLDVKTPGGHAWSDAGSPSAVHILAELISTITAIKLPKDPRTSMNVGVIHGGTSINTIAGSACCELDLRSEDPVTLANLIWEVKNAAAALESSTIHIQLIPIGERPSGALAKDHRLIQLTENSLTKLGIQPFYEVGSTDANIPLSLGYPAVCIGITRGAYAHTDREMVELAPIEVGLRQVVSILAGAWNK